MWCEITNKNETAKENKRINKALGNDTIELWKKENKRPKKVYSRVRPENLPNLGKYNTQGSRV